MILRIAHRRLLAYSCFILEALSSCTDPILVATERDGGYRFVSQETAVTGQDDSSSPRRCAANVWAALHGAAVKPTVAGTRGVV